MKLNIGAGPRRIAGYTGVDIVKRVGADIVAPAHAIPLPDGSVSEIMAIHLIEHVHRWECEWLLAEWFRLLKPKGLLVLEAPDLIKCCHNILNNVHGKHPDQLGLWGLFGDDRLKDPLMMHKTGWTFKTLSAVAETVGFINITEHHTQFHAAGHKVRDFRLEARKP